MSVNADVHLLAPVGFALILGLSLYRRIRKSFGRQPIQPMRLRLRAGLLSLLGATLLASSSPRAALFQALLAGVLIGSVLAVISLRSTRYEFAADGKFYTPHTSIGILVTALFIARMAYRIMQAPPGMTGRMDASPTLIPHQGSPLTGGILGVVIGYYVAYSVGILRTVRLLEPSGAPLPARSSDEVNPAD